MLPTVVAELATEGGGDNFETIMACIETVGVGNCLHFGTIWRNTSLAVSVK